MRELNCLEKVINTLSDDNRLIITKESPMNNIVYGWIQHSWQVLMTVVFRKYLHSYIFASEPYEQAMI